MGVYTYTLKASQSCNVQLGDGRVVTAHYLTYQCRAGDCDIHGVWPGDDGYGLVRRNAARIRRAADQWSGVPEVYYILEKPEQGAELYVAEGREAAVWHDCDRLPGVQVGTLNRKEKVGRKRAWTLMTAEDLRQFELLKAWEQRERRELRQAAEEERAKEVERRRLQQKRDQSLDSSGL